MKRGIDAVDLETTNAVDLAIAIKRLVNTKRAFVLAKSWCTDETAFVCWVSTPGREVGIPFVDADLEQAIRRAARWAEGNEGDWV